MKILSETPATDTDAILEKPFRFQIENEIFEIEPLSLPKYLETERNWQSSLTSVLYYRAGWDKQLAKALDIEKRGMEALSKAVTFTKIIERLLIPNKIIKRKSHKKRIRKILRKHNLKYITQPSLWCFNIAKWIEINTTFMELLECASYISRYMGEKKTLLSNILHKQEIGSITKEKQTSPPSHVMRLVRGALDPSLRKNHTTKSSAM